MMSVGFGRDEMTMERTDIPHKEVSERFWDVLSSVVFVGLSSILLVVAEYVS